MMSARPRVISVRHGGIRPAGSWLYVWIDTADGSIAYVGATGFDPELRAYLHLTSQNPDHGRVRATVPDYEKRDFDVLSFELAEDVPRDQAKKLLIARLGEERHIETEDVGIEAVRSVIDPIVDAVEGYIGALRSVRPCPVAGNR
ncbi:hypothetical protein [Sinomonas humi]|uniref:GIY-YIG domain-containing protein n=1 Tax=Sinomonas humi TaxID=1338436 RepID=A0A0B2AI48_9MICC|nr:hypothetical protein [Sinomonas humi]KHL01598.1 hypothetical protein LK10_15230 [Sinomonas humi]